MKRWLPFIFVFSFSLFATICSFIYFAYFGDTDFLALFVGLISCGNFRFASDLLPKKDK